MLVRAKRLKGIDVAKGRIFSTFGAASPSVTAQFEDDEGEVVEYLHSDYDSIIKGFATGMALMNRGVGHTFSTPHVHNINPAENYMRAVKESALAMQALAGLPDMHSLNERCWSHSADMHALTLPRRFHNEAHKNVAPIEAFTGQKRVGKMCKVSSWVCSAGGFAKNPRDRSWGLQLVMMDGASRSVERWSHGHTWCTALRRINW
jgi:hypothetical protein